MERVCYFSLALSLYKSRSRVVHYKRNTVIFPALFSVAVTAVVTPSCIRPCVPHEQVSAVQARQEGVQVILGENNIDSGNVPHDPRGLTQVEEMLSARDNRPMRVYLLKGGQRRYTVDTLQTSHRTSATSSTGFGVPPPTLRCLSCTAGATAMEHTRTS